MGLKNDVTKKKSRKLFAHDEDDFLDPFLLNNSSKMFSSFIFLKKKYFSVKVLGAGESVK